MGKNLIIVESPAKAKTIEKFLGKNYKVKSSFGHIRDLVKKNYGVDVNNNYKPEYEILAEKRKLVKELRQEVKTAKSILLASDEDREGEAIAWHLWEVLKLKNKNTKRIVFNEITKQAIQHAVANPRDINFNLVNSQQARRILDRLVGFELSSVLWKKVQSKLSAGRVQSVAVRFLVEREREIMNFIPKSFYKVTAIFKIIDTDGKIKQTETELSKRFDNEKETHEFISQTCKANYTIKSVEKKPAKKSPAPPFTTSSLQQEASRKLHFPVQKTMRTAQKLYEAGKITYMRTDSVNLSNQAKKSLKNEIIKEFGKKYYKKRNYKTKAKIAQEAHEAIRPTYIENKFAGETDEERKLYELIRNRTLASQMSNAKFERTTIEINIDNSQLHYSTVGEVLIFAGFLKVFSQNNENNKTTFLPKVIVGQKVDLQKIDAIERFTKHLPRYTEASLVKKLEELGIGRPSTYAPTISTIQNRGYVIKENREGRERKYTHLIYIDTIKKYRKTETFGNEKSKMFPTDIAMVVTDFLAENFTNIMDYNFTAEVEKEFDNIAGGKNIWYEMLDRFYKDFHLKVEDTIKNAERNTGERILGIDKETGKQVSVRIGRFGPIAQLGVKEDTEKPKFASINKEYHIEKITLDEAIYILKNSNNGRLLGKDPKTGKNVYVRFARYGAVVQTGETEDKEKPKFASLLKGMTIDSINLAEALELLKLPRDVGMYESKKVVAAIGRFGPYVRHNSKFVSLKKDDNPLTVNLERAIVLIEEKREKDRKNLIKEFPEDKKLKIIKDRWGRPCIFYNRKYHNIKDIKNPENLTLKQCLGIVGKMQKKKKKKK